MQVIIPAILPTSQEDLEEKLRILHGQVKMVQIDAVDGRFISPASWPYIPGTPEFPADYSLPFLGDMHFEIDLMVTNPEEVSGTWINAGAERIVIHAESTIFLEKAIKDLEVRYGHAKDFAPDLLSLGLAINIGSDLSLIEPFLDHADYVQFMGISIIGKQGEPFDSRVLRKIAAFKKKYPQMTVQVDGGVSLVTAPALLTAGIDRLIVGSALWKAPNIPEELEKFNQLVQEYGIYS
jgi:ribulose-phosphate 3-epimerase